MDPLEHFYSAWFSPKLKLLGFKLNRPFCLGHLLTLQAFNSPLLRIGEKDFRVHVSDLIVALQVCERAQWPFSHFELEKSERIARITARLTRSTLLNRKGTNALDEAVLLFCKWKATCERGPELWDSNDPNARPLSAPRPIALATKLVMNGFPERRAYTMGIGLLQFYSATISEQQGSDIMFETVETQKLKEHASQHPTPEQIAAMSDDELLVVITKAIGDEDQARTWVEGRRAHLQALAAISPDPANPITAVKLKK